MSGIEELAGARRIYVEFTLTQKGQDISGFVIELFTDVCPSTCKNFIDLIEGAGKYRYKGTPIHRILPGAFISGGDVVSGRGDGDPGFSISDEVSKVKVDDECFAVPHDRAGLVGMANRGKPHTSSTHFYVTLAPLRWMDKQTVAFGKVVRGLDSILKMVSTTETNNERPVDDIIVSSCKVLTAEPTE